LPIPRANTPFGPLANPLVATGAAAAWLVLLLVFRFAPQLDLAISRWFFDPAACAANEWASGIGCSGFPLYDTTIGYSIRAILQPVPTILGVILLIVLVAELWMGRRWRNAGVRLKTVLLSTLVIGPALIVNGLLKPFWGRPRPWMTQEFGGQFTFVEAGSKAGLCASNCSFVSGEASSAGWLMCIALLLAVHRYFRSAFAVGAVAIVMAGLRVAYGAHYFSDAVLGFTMTIVIFLVLAAFAERTMARRR
jgi:membrane-associated PAP2 superfamily phosphatase